MSAEIPKLLFYLIGARNQPNGSWPEPALNLMSRFRRIPARKRTVANPAIAAEGVDGRDVRFRGAAPLD